MGAVLSFIKFSPQLIQQVGLYFISDQPFIRRLVPSLVSAAAFMTVGTDLFELKLGTKTRSLVNVGLCTAITIGTSYYLGFSRGSLLFLLGTEVLQDFIRTATIPLLIMM